MLALNPNLYVEIVPYTGLRSPSPHPVDDGRFDTSRIYKVLGCYSPSETSESYFVLSNQRREIWFISNRHVRAHSIHASDELSLSKTDAAADAALHGLAQSAGAAAVMTLPPRMPFHSPARDSAA